MGRNTSILLGDYFDDFIKQQKKPVDILRQVKLSGLH
jgi:hypothetical protein